MTKYNSENMKLSNYQLDKLESAIKNDSAVTLRLSSNMMGESNDKTNYTHNLLVKLLQIIYQLI